MGLYVFNLPISVLGDWKNTSIAHVIIIIKSEVSTFPIIIFFRGCVPEMFSSLLCSLWWVQIFGYVLACRSYSFFCTVHHLIITIVQTYLKALDLWNACQIYFVECVSKIKHILFVIHLTICGAVCFQFIHFCCDDWENRYALSYYHHQIRSMNYYPLFRVKSWNNGVRCMSVYILILMEHVYVNCYMLATHPFVIRQPLYLCLIICTIKWYTHRTVFLYPWYNLNLFYEPFASALLLICSCRTYPSWGHV